MKTTNEYLTKIRQFKQQFAEKYGIISIGIFGSVARGEQHEESDLDVFVELKDPDPFIMFDIKEERKVGLFFDLIQHFLYRLVPHLQIYSGFLGIAA